MTSICLACFANACERFICVHRVPLPTAQVAHNSQHSYCPTYRHWTRGHYCQSGDTSFLYIYIFSNNLIHFFKLLQNKIYWFTSAEKVAMRGIWSIEAIVPTLPLYLYFFVLLTKVTSRSLYSSAGNQVHFTRLYFCDFSNGSQKWWPESLIQQFTVIN